VVDLQEVKAVEAVEVSGTQVMAVGITHMVMVVEDRVVKP
jgi:hypothetical protein